MNKDSLILNKFNVTQEIFEEAILKNPSSQGYILGAITETCLVKYLEKKDYEVIRIKEKPSGSFDSKTDDARGDFYIRKKNWEKDKCLVIESKGLKSNSEFRGDKITSKEKLYKYLNNLVFKKNNKHVFEKGLNTYNKEKDKWKNKKVNYPPFNWDKNFPGPESESIKHLWKNSKELNDWCNQFTDEDCSEKFYRNNNGPVRILETHQPSTRVSRITKKKQAAPLVTDFNIMSVNLFLRTGKHEFVFMNSNKISHSPSSPEHLYQNYTIDVLVKGLKEEPIIRHPWYNDIDDCINKTKPSFRIIDQSQVDNREL